MKRIIGTLFLVGFLVSCNSEKQAENLIDEKSNVVEDTGSKIAVSGINLPTKIGFGGTVREFTGAGTRVKFFMRIYVLGVYMKEPTKDPEVIINADEPMSMRMHIISSMLTNDVMVKYIREGFSRGLGLENGDFGEYKTHVDLICSVFSSEPTEVGDVYDFHYVPGVGTSGSKNSVLYSFDNLTETTDEMHDSTDAGSNMLKLNYTKKGQAAIPSLGFKKAMFGIWFSDDPVDPKLKDEVLQE